LIQEIAKDFMMDITFSQGTIIQLKEQVHKSASRYCLRYATSYLFEEPHNLPYKNDIHANVEYNHWEQKRNVVACKLMKELGYSQFLLDDEGLRPISQGTIHDEDNKTHWVLFRWEQVVEYIKQFGPTDLLMSPHSDDDWVCPSCGELLYRGKHEYYCMSCGYETMGEQMQRDLLIYFLTKWSAYTGGAGASYASHPTIKITKGHVLITQNTGKDI
jgi:rubrerythrin